MLLIFTMPPGYADESHQNDTSPTPSIEGETVSDAVDPDAPLIDPDSTLYKGIKYAGKLHLMVLHFPIAFLLAAMLVQWYRVVKGQGDSVVTVMLWFGALGAIGAAALGWMYAYDSVYFGDDEQILFRHRWLGTGTAVLATLVLLLRNRLGPKLLAVALTLCAGLVAVAAHFGASLVYGPEFLLKF
ncbi:MAG: hypothetical protein WBG04_03565 [Haloferula sp.]